MIDNTFKLFEIHLPETSAKNKALVLNGSSAFLYASKNVYSELDELNFSDINKNDYGFGFMDIEFFFDNNFFNPYFNFYAGCFSIRTNNGAKIKLNGYAGMKYYSKINKNNKVVVGIRYYFKNKEDIKHFESCKLFCIEGFIAIKKKRNVYGIMCRLIKDEEQWSVVDCNTYRTYKYKKITSLRH